MSSLPVILLLLAQAPVQYSGTAADSDGRPLAGVEVFLSQGHALDGTVPIVGRASTDSQGRYQMTAPYLTWRMGSVYPSLLGYRPGFALVDSLFLPRRTDQAGYRLVFHSAGRRVVMLRGEGGRPLAGVGLTPHSVLRPGQLFKLPPDALADRMEVTTGSDGRAELVCLEPATELVTLRATIPGMGYTLWQSLAISTSQKPSSST